MPSLGELYADELGRLVYNTPHNQPDSWECCPARVREECCAIGLELFTKGYEARKRLELLAAFSPSPPPEVTVTQVGDLTHVDVRLPEGHTEAHPAITERDEGRLTLTEIAKIVGALRCPQCGKSHVDDNRTPEEQAWVAIPHRTHKCVDDAAGGGCGHEWRLPNADLVQAVRELEAKLQERTVPVVEQTICERNVLRMTLEELQGTMQNLAQENGWTALAILAMKVNDLVAQHRRPLGWQALLTFAEAATDTRRADQTAITQLAYEDALAALGSALLDCDDDPKAIFAAVATTLAHNYDKIRGPDDPSLDTSGEDADD